jgi:uncharacterized RmlC-like cupin family protein
MFKLQKEEILERVLFSEGVAAACSKAESTHSEPSGDHWPRPILLERAAYLRKLARFSEGSAGETIREYGGYNITLMVQLRTSDAEVHEAYSATLTVLDGQATLVTGGTLDHARRAGPDEIKGTAISGGSSRELRSGDVIHVPASMPHQLLLAGDRAFSCLVLSIRELDGAR